MSKKAWEMLEEVKADESALDVMEKLDSVIAHSRLLIDAEQAPLASAHLFPKTTALKTSFTN